MAMNWWRAHHGMANDVKLSVISLKSKSKRCEVGWLWFCLLERASSNEDDRGSIDGISPEELSIQTDIPEDQVGRILTEFRHRGMISAEGRLTAWDKRQPIEEDLTAAARKRKERERRRLLLSTTSDKCHGSHDRDIVTVTPVTVEQRRTEQNREEQNREEQNRTEKPSARDALDLEIESAAERIYTRHHWPARRCSWAVITKKLHAIAKESPSSGRIARIRQIDVNHGTWCAHWELKDGEFAMGLEKWLNPAAKRFDEPAPEAATYSPQRLLL